MGFIPEDELPQKECDKPITSGPLSSDAKKCKKVYEQTLRELRFVTGARCHRRAASTSLDGLFNCRVNERGAKAALNYLAKAGSLFVDIRSATGGKELLAKNTIFDREFIKKAIRRHSLAQNGGDFDQIR